MKRQSDGTDRLHLLRPSLIFRSLRKKYTTTDLLNVIIRAVLIAASCHSVALESHMPAVTHDPSTTHPPTLQPPDPNQIHDVTAHTTPGLITHQPSPAVLTTVSQNGAHVLPRRFLGPMPENVAHSAAREETRRRITELRQGALRRIRGEDVDGIGRSSKILGAVRIAQKVRIRRLGRHGEEVEEDVDIDPFDDGGEDGKKKKRKDVWVGDSFTIGREFLSLPPDGSKCTEPLEQQLSRKALLGDTKLPSASLPEDGCVSGPPGSSRQARPSNSARSTLETFVTARTQVSKTAASHSSLSIDHSVLRPEQVSRSRTSSTRPLMGDRLDDDARPRSQAGELSRTASGGLKKRLKSAIRRASVTPVRPTSDLGVCTTQRAVAAKTVHFPVQVPDLLGSVSEGPRKGNKQPADPQSVLSREGGEAAGTSAGAAEEAMDTDEDEEDVLPGDVLMRGRWRCK